MTKAEHLADPDSCMNRAREEEQVFVLLARDVAAPAAIRAWADERIKRGKNRWSDPQIAEALRISMRMEAQQEEARRKA